MNTQTNTRPAHLIGQFFKYFILFYSALIVVKAIVLGLFYFWVSATVAADIMTTIVTATLSKVVFVVLILLIPALVAAGLLSGSGARARGSGEQLKLFSQLLDLSTDSIFVHDLHGKCIYANELACQVRGYKKEELMGTSLYELNVPEYARLIEPNIKELVQKGDSTFESVHLCKSQSAIPVEVHNRLIQMDGKKLILGVVRDLTERKKTEAELRQSAEMLRKAMDGTIQAIGLTTEMKDPYTAGHQQRVGRIANAIAIEMGLSEYQREGLRVAGSLHDIGKISVPSEILSKPGKLKATEFSLIKDHAQVGYDILKAVEFPWPVADMVVQHHERMDGSGYPAGLKGDQIMLEAAIMAVADVVESMASHRPYRPAFSIEKALLELIQKKGTLYHPQVVDSCVTLFNEKGFSL